MRRPVRLLWVAALLNLGTWPALAEDVVPENPLGGRFQQLLGYRRKAPLLRTVPANSVIQCSLRCLGEAQCKAANFRPADESNAGSGSGGGGACDLLESQLGGLVESQAGAVTLRLPASCRHLMRKFGYRKDGVYRHRGLPAPLYCDMTLDGGGWTLLVASVSTEGWTLDYVMERRKDTPGIDINYSILGLGHHILSMSTRDRFAYRLEAGGRQRWGGVWRALRTYTLTGSHSNQSVGVARLATFDDWPPATYDTPRDIVPWVNRGGAFNGRPLLTTCDEHGPSWFGTLVTAHVDAAFGTSPWIHHNTESRDGPRLYWVRETIN